jgi:hypothetical protein
MLARRLTTSLPAMTLPEALETTRIHRVTGRTGDRTALVTTRLLTGSARHARRGLAECERADTDGGEISLAHGGNITLVPRHHCLPSSHTIGYRSHPLGLWQMVPDWSAWCQDLWPERYYSLSGLMAAVRVHPEITAVPTDKSSQAHQRQICDHATR